MHFYHIYLQTKAALSRFTVSHVIWPLTYSMYYYFFVVPGFEPRNLHILWYALSLPTELSSRKLITCIIWVCIIWTSKCSRESVSVIKLLTNWTPVSLRIPIPAEPKLAPIRSLRPFNSGLKYGKVDTVPSCWPEKA